MAIPTAVWGTKYFNLVYSDLGPGDRTSAGFMIVGRDDGTQVTITLKDQNARPYGIYRTLVLIVLK